VIVETICEIQELKLIMEFFPVLVNLVFTLIFCLLVGTFYWEVRVKMNYVAKRILLSEQKTFKNKLLVVNLVQMLISFALITMLKVLKVNIFPGQDFSLVCFYYFTIKFLQLRQDLLFQDAFGLLPLGLLSFLLFNNTSGSILQVSSQFFNWTLFFLPFPAFTTALITVVAVSTVSLFSVVTCASALFVILALRNSKAPLIILILFCTSRWIISFHGSNYILAKCNDRKNGIIEDYPMTMIKENITMKLL